MYAQESFLENKRLLIIVFGSSGSSGGGKQQQTAAEPCLSIPLRSSEWGVFYIHTPFPFSLPQWALAVLSLLRVSSCFLA